MAEVKCEYCQNIIVDCIVRCSECSEIVLCLQCFACSVEMGQHKRSHDYQILSLQPSEKEVVGADVIFPGNEDKWTVAEEELLLDAVEHHGFGSWQEVSDYVKSKTIELCEEHFMKYYMDGNIGQATLPTEIPMQCFDHTKSSGYTGPGVDLTVTEQQELGYMSLRDDFEREFNNDAESSISGLAIHYTDTAVDTAFQLCQVNIYRQQLKERSWRKDVAKRYGVLRNCTSVGWKSYRTAWKKRTREEKEYQDIFKKLGRFMSYSDYLNLFHNLRRQEKLQRHLQTLIKFNSQGFKSLHGKLRMHVLQMNGFINGSKKRRKKVRRSYR